MFKIADSSRDPYVEEKRLRTKGKIVIVTPEWIGEDGLPVDEPLLVEVTRDES